MQILIWIGIQMEGRIRIGYLISSYCIYHNFFLNIEVKITLLDFLVIRYFLMLRDFLILCDFLILRDFLESLIKFRN
jgi:hypothetical protein